MALSKTSADVTLVRLEKCRDRVSNLGDYDAVRAAFRSAEARALLDGLPGGGL
jgi:hypothetical protein